MFVEAVTLREECKASFFAMQVQFREQNVLFLCGHPGAGRDSVSVYTPVEQLLTRTLWKFVTLEKRSLK